MTKACDVLDLLSFRLITGIIFKVYYTLLNLTDLMTGTSTYFGMVLNRFQQCG